ncbi:hypothetical protein BG015_005950 [Linnemannia schmuckeri]|uniref:Uncharacterized protein n=1 Tax=Linnemannia schmuckeri TaxID=64567 RepID=A0A9P5S0N7_9FUNG|nr:hypothetical protein BG015_005950 [Linnemannia schmuckeri]
MTLSSKPIPTWVRTLARSLAGVLVVMLHMDILFDETWPQWAAITLLLIILPVVLGSYLNLKEHGRWFIYYLIWFQLMSSQSKRYTHEFGFDLLLFLTMDGAYRRHLQTLIGDKVIPSRVYFSSWISDDSKLSAFLAAHRSLDPKDDDKPDDDTEQQTNAATTTLMRTRTKWLYALVTGALVLNTCVIIASNFWGYNCYLMAYTFNDFTTEDDYKEYRNYCSSLWRWVYNYTIRGWPNPVTLLTIATAFLSAAAWSKLPTMTVIRAWIRMWPNNNNDGDATGRRSRMFVIKKIHYVVFIYLIKWPTHVLIEMYSIRPEEDLKASNLKQNLFVWEVVFCYATTLAFALAILWNLYAIHSGLDTCQDRQQQYSGGFEHKERVEGSGDVDGISGSEKKLLDDVTHSTHVVDLSPSL